MNMMNGMISSYVTAGSTISLGNNRDVSHLILSYLIPVLPQGPDPHATPDPRGLETDDPRVESLQIALRSPPGFLIYISAKKFIACEILEITVEKLQVNSRKSESVFYQCDSVWE